jgi:hypothetical protein
MEVSGATARSTNRKELSGVQVTGGEGPWQPIATPCASVPEVRTGVKRGLIYGGTRGLLTPLSADPLTLSCPSPTSIPELHALV